MADEVEVLARQAADGAGRVSERIAGIQEAARATGAALAGIGGLVRDMNRDSLAIVEAIQRGRSEPGPVDPARLSRS